MESKNTAITLVELHLSNKMFFLFVFLQRQCPCDFGYSLEHNLNLQSSLVESSSSKNRQWRGLWIIQSNQVTIEKTCCCQICTHATGMALLAILVGRSDSLLHWSRPKIFPTISWIWIKFVHRSMVLRGWIPTESPNLQNKCTVHFWDYVETLHFFVFQFLWCDNSVLKIWLGLGQKNTTWLELGKDHVLPCQCLIKNLCFRHHKQCWTLSQFVLQNICFWCHKTTGNSPGVLFKK